MAEKRVRFNNFTSDNFLCRKRTLEHNTTQDFKIKCKQIWHIGNGKYYLYKW